MATNLSGTQYKFTTNFWQNVFFSCFIKLSSNFTSILVLIEFNKKAGLLLGVVGNLILSSANPLGFHSEKWSVKLFFLKSIFKLAEALNKLEFYHVQNNLN